MNERAAIKAWGVAAVLVGVASAAASRWGMRAVIGVLAGGVWNLVSLWGLVRLLNAWLGPQPSTRRVMGWLFVKFPLLYLLAFVIMRSPAVSPLGFGVGFTVVLAVAVGWYGMSIRRLAFPRSHGR